MVTVSCAGEPLTLLVTSVPPLWFATACARAMAPLALPASSSGIAAVTAESAAD